MNHVLNSVDRLQFRLTAAAFFLLGMYLRVMRYHKRELWGDELIQYNDTAGPLKPFWIDGYNYGDHSGFPGDYLLTYPFIKIFGLHKWGLAIPHILLTIVGFYFLYKVCRYYCKSVWGYAIVF